MVGGSIPDSLGGKHWECPMVVGVSKEPGCLCAIRIAGILV